MKIWRLVSGILSIVSFIIVTFQSCAVGLVNAVEENKNDTSGAGGIAVAFGLLVAGIVATTLWKNKSKGGDIALIILYGVTALMGFFNQGTFGDLVIWSSWALICAVVAAIALILNSRAGYNGAVEYVVSSPVPNVVSNIAKIECPNCQAKIDADSIFCGVCGQKLPEHTFCKKCGKERVGHEKFCSKCGTSFGNVSTPLPTNIDSAKPSSNNMKMIVPVLIGVIALALIGGGWWYYNSTKNPLKDNVTSIDSNVFNVLTEPEAAVEEHIIEMSDEEVIREALDRIFSYGLKQEDQQEAIFTCFSKDFRELNNKVNEVDIKNDEIVGFWNFDLWSGGQEGNPQKAIIKRIYNVTDNSADADVELVFDFGCCEKKYHLSKSSREEWEIDDIDNLKKMMREYIQQMNNMEQ